ncbi:phosphatidylinositol-glycan biosynthesis class S protein-domain-containing protein [Coprinopsis sp. MPI-PUGE-AT-0042]|nr:phosphatidylinositol-glycan biosynthesis class S protein-domain-containing protein [Coprinopsis sp. MPI-PUGE-AT-0042]
MNPPPPPSSALPAALRDPSTLFFQHAGVRRLIILAYWIAIAVAVPIWWYTTSIERLPLPISQASQEIRRPLELRVDICVQETIPEYTQLIQSALDRAKEARRLEGLQFNVLLYLKCKDNVDIRDPYTIASGPSKIISGRTIQYPLESTHSAHELAETLIALVYPKSDSRVVEYSSRYRLAFSLLNEDAATGTVVAGWDIKPALSRYISPILERVSQLHNVTVESQVQFHAPLAFKVRELENGDRGLSYEDLTVFVNSAEWTLSSSFSNDPVIHMILFIPSAEHGPLRILDADGTVSTSNAFILPQWGGIVIHNPSPGDIGVENKLSPRGLHMTFTSFSSQLLSLLGVPPLPSGIQRDSKENTIFSDWQLDALLRRRTLETVSGTKETLGSFVKLVNRIENMPIGQSVSDDVHNALNSLNQVYDQASSSLSQAFSASSAAYDYASRAFFNPGMLALLYFPAEHKYAIYTPLFASAMLPLFVAALREFKAWKAESKARLAT